MFRRSICLLLINVEGIRQRYRDICHVKRGMRATRGRRVRAFDLLLLLFQKQISLTQFVSMPSVVAAQNQFERARCNQLCRAHARDDDIGPCHCRCRSSLEQTREVNSGEYRLSCFPAGECEFLLNAHTRTVDLAGKTNKRKGSRALPCRAFSLSLSLLLSLSADNAIGDETRERKSPVTSKLAPLADRI